jgi:hypothetical protein
MIPSHRLIANSVFANTLLPRFINSNAKDWGLNSFKTPKAAFAAHCLGFLRWELHKICAAENKSREYIEDGFVELERQNLIEQTGRRDDDHVQLSKYFIGKCNTAMMPVDPNVEIEDF